MKFRTVINLDPAQRIITYKDNVLLIGSCFASYIGEQLQIRKMPVMINPAGTVYNPISVLNTLNALISLKTTTVEELHYNNGDWFSFNHYTDFSSDDKVLLLNKINENNLRAGNFFRNARFLFITFGTARVYRLKETGKIVANCHKLPASKFDNELLNTDEIVKVWMELLDNISAFNPGLKIIFTISPVRHWKDGAHGNQVSKAILFLAIEELMKHKSGPSYFPAYEIQMDDLRDYRYYDDDMLHPSSSAIEYIWEKFSSVYFDRGTAELQSEVLKITRALSHRFITDSPKKKRTFAEIMLGQISEIESRTSQIDFSAEKNYFRSLIE